MKAWWTVVAFVCAWGGIWPSTAAAQAQKKGLLVIVNDPQGTDLKKIRDRLEETILSGAKSGTTLEDTKHVYDANEVVSPFGIELTGQVVQTLLSLGTMSRAATDDAIGQVRRQFKAVPVNILIARVLPPTSTSGETEIDLMPKVTVELFNVKDSEVKLRAELGVCGESWTEVFEEARNLAIRIGAGQIDSTAPKAGIRVSPAKVVPLGTEVVLDACATTDAEYDALLRFWSRIEGGEVVESFEGMRRIFKAQKPGSYTFRLSVSEAIHPRSEPPDEVTITVMEPPVASAGRDKWIDGDCNDREGPSCNTTFLPKITGYDLRPDCSKVTAGGPPSYCWRQSDGPGEAPLHCNMAECWLHDLDKQVPGYYTFQLIVANQVGIARDEVVYAISGQPVLDAGPPRKASPGKDLVLDGGFSHDDLDTEPRFFWQIVPCKRDPSPTAEKEDPGEQGSARILDPSSRQPHFVADHFGDYCVEGTMRAKRKLNGIVQWAAPVRDRVTITSAPPSIWLFAGLAAYRPAKESDPDLRLSFTSFNIGGEYWPLPWIGLRVENSIVNVVRNDADFLDRVHVGGIISVDAMLRVVATPILSLRTFTGPTYYGYLGSENDFGLRGGVQATLQSKGGWRVQVDLGLAIRFLGIGDPTTGVAFGAGLGYPL